MDNQTTTPLSAASVAPGKGLTTAQIAGAGFLALLLSAFTILAGGGHLMEYATAALTLVNGPLIDGPLLNLGDTLSDLQIGQFQQ